MQSAGMPADDSRFLKYMLALCTKPRKTESVMFETSGRKTHALSGLRQTAACKTQTAVSLYALPDVPLRSGFRTHAEGRFFRIAGIIQAGLFRYRLYSPHEPHALEIYPFIGFLCRISVRIIKIHNLIFQNDGCPRQR